MPAYRSLSAPHAANHAVRRNGLITGLTVFCLLGLAFSTFAADAYFDPDKEARRIFTTIMSPYCPGLLLADCSSSAAAVLRDSIKAQLHRGRPSQEIMDELVDSFGDNILGAPPNRGVGRLAWLGPIAALSASLLIIFWWVRQRREPIPDSEPVVAQVSDPAEVNPALRQKLEEELKQLD
jgi:cytochrome c-type biogenesis protein CcmH